MNNSIVIIGGGPSGATAAHELAKKGTKVAFIDKAGRIKPCGGAVPPRLILDFEIPDSQVVAKIRTARMISPTARKVDMPIENGFVGMIDRENFDAFLRKRACDAGAVQYTGTFLKIERTPNQTLIYYKDKKTGKEKTTNIQQQNTSKTLQNNKQQEKHTSKTFKTHGTRIKHITAQTTHKVRINYVHNTYKYICIYMYIISIHIHKYV